MSEKIVSSFDGTHIYYKILGKGAPLFFIHGNSNSHDYFYQQMAFFKEHYQLILMDTRDHGRSSNNAQDLNYQDIMLDILAILKNEDLKKTSFIGFSDGANIALAFGAKYPSHCDKLILASPNMTYEQLKPSQRWMMDTAYYVTNNLLPLKKIPRVLRLAMLNIPITDRQRLTWEPPTLVVIGDHDITTPKSMLDYIQPIPNMQLEVIPRCLHSIPLLKPTIFNRLSLNFLMN
ncbi:hypothetical protein CBF34_00915 [Vagococcus penaei]|uniref:Uncharacterized protein n=1 Tax=Vagococcus penaei TaxID=633807 RepID=A0A1Q2D8J8_9ENTE|nr:alpha/beta hydrolase [Vagococcus penaei]AQP54611.1 hypothetical protein BW732_10625 [Vagococcus penaei]RSU06676.1 hypothetical protein CBF34_00915 [Vagococcus penaei]